MHSEKNAVEGTKRLRCSGDEAMGTVHCRDCMEARNEQTERKDLETQRRKDLATQQRDRARLLYD